MEVSVEELAGMIWGLTSEQQAKLIRELSEVADEWKAIAQLEAICNELSREKRLNKIKRLLMEFVSRI